MHIAAPSATLILLLQIAMTLATALLAGGVVQRLGQPRVIGEILAGIALGPTLFGALAPDAYRFLFPEASFASLRLVASVGVILFMFSVGLHLDLSLLRRNRRSAVIISQVSIALPLALGLALAKPLYSQFAPKGTSPVAFALFLGMAMSITAFPVLARILAEHDLMRTPIASLALTSAAADDLMAWFLLALVSAIARSTALAAAIVMFATAVAFTVVMLTIVKPLLARVRVTDGTALLILFASAATTELIGIHAIFGAFLAGTVIPRQSESGQTLGERLTATNVVLLPLFFAYIGLHTDMRMLLDPRTALVALLVIAVATAGKLGGSAIAARLTGSTLHEALVLGTLMNTRGLVELIALGIALDLGVITRTMFTIMVLMALATTFATSPLLRLWKQLEKAPAPVALEVASSE